MFERYWLFAAFCFIAVVILVRLVLRERVTLQASLSLLLLLGLMSFVALFPNVASRLAQTMGFTLASNFFFAAGIGALMLLHVHSLVTLSRVELRSITLTQELAILREKLDQLSEKS